MGLLSFLKRKPDDQAKAAAQSDSVDSVQQARTRARQRLVGSVVLVAMAVIGFPLLFETQPRPLPVDTPIEISRKDAAVKTQAKPPVKPSTAQASAPAAAVITERADEAGKEVVVAAASTPTSTTSPQPASAAKPEPKPEPKTAAKPPADNTRAQALLEGKEATPKKPAASDNGRFIVQIGAFAEAAAARDARQKVDKLGFKSFTQDVDTAAGKRIRVRVGPFPTREEADKVAAKIKAGGLPSAVFAL